MPRARRITKPIPTSRSQTDTIEINDYSLGMNSFVSNDKFPVKNQNSNMWRLVKNGRINTFGEYETRKGTDFHSAAAGETQDQTQTSTTGAADQSFSETVRIAQKFTAGASARLTKVDLRLKNDSSALGTIIVELWSDDGTNPDTLLGRSSIAETLLTSSYQYLTAYFMSAPSLTSGTAYWLVVYTQASGSGSYRWSSTTSATTAQTSTDSGMSWSSTSFAMNFRQYYATSGKSKGLWRAYKSDGTKVTLMVQGSTLYSVDNVTGALTTVKSGLNAAATDYLFVLVNDIVYYINEYDGYRKWDFTTESQISTTNYSNICLHNNLMMLVETLDKTKLVWSNFAAYETFTSTDFAHVPAPKTGDPIVALHSLNGYLLIWTKNNKHILSGDDNATFRLDEAPDQKGTYTQHTTASDKNFAYFLADDGVYRTNGSEAQALSENIYQDIVSLANKDEAVLMVNRGRLYLWFPAAGSGVNNVCYVWNLNFSGESDTVESYDTGAYVARAFNAYDDDDGLLVASSLVGQVFWQEQDSNDYTNAGDDIEFELQTHYFVGSSPAVMKQNRFWEPRFSSQGGNYTIRCEYATDLRNNWQLRKEFDILGSGSVWGDATWGAFTWGTTRELQAQLYVPGEYRRTAVRYKHYATRQPHKFLGHTFVNQTRRLR